MKLVFHIESRADAEFAASLTRSLLSGFDAAPATPRTRTRTETMAEPIADTSLEQAETTEPERASVESYVKAQAVIRGILWTRKNVFSKYNVRKPSDLSDAQLAELAAHTKATEAEAA